MRSHPRGSIFSSAAIFTSCLLSTLPAHAQLPTLAGGAGNMTFFAPHEAITSRGARLEGTAAQPARITVPNQLDIQAQTIGFDFSGSNITEIRAVTGVHFKVNLAPSNGQPAQIEATCDTATLQPSTRTLTLIGHVNGFYQIGSGARNSIAGDRAVLRYVNRAVSADVTAGGEGVLITVPAESTGHAGDLGDVTMRAQRLVVEGQTARLIGNASAISTGNANAFNVRATEFDLTRAADGTIDRLETTGRTHIILDLPPDPAPAAGVTPPVAAPVAPPATPVAAPSVPPAGGAAGTPASTPGGAGNGILGNVGRPTHVEVEADHATLTRADQTLTLNGNVAGSYQLSTPGVAPNTYTFSGERAILRYVPQAGAGSGGNVLAGFSADVTGANGKAAEIQGPPLNFSF